jgi:hypothetical protein
MGSGLKGNVSLKVNGYGTRLEEGIETINRFVFKYHWRLKVNGKVYDPIFHSIDGDPVEWELEGGKYEADDGSCFFRDVTAPTELGEFVSTCIWITDWKVFENSVVAMTELYNAYKKEVDGILSGSVSTKDMFRSDRTSYRKAKELVKNSVGDPATFRKVAEVGEHYTIGALNKQQVEAVGKILELAAKK